jgi:hypothetical protein
MGAFDRATDRANVPQFLLSLVLGGAGAGRSAPRSARDVWGAAVAGDEFHRAGAGADLCRRRKIQKEHEKCLEKAIEDADCMSITTLFTHHPFYRDINIRWDANATLASYKIYSPKSGKWKEYNTATFEIIDRHIKIYEKIGEKVAQVSKIENECKFIVEASPEDIFNFE